MVGAVGGRSLQGMFLQLLVVALACFLTGVRMGSSGSAQSLPVAGLFYVENADLGEPADVPVMEAIMETEEL
jgi:hypothetical protein